MISLILNSLPTDQDAHTVFNPPIPTSAKEVRAYVSLELLLILSNLDPVPRWTLELGKSKR